MAELQSHINGETLVSQVSHQRGRGALAPQMIDREKTASELAGSSVREDQMLSSQALLNDHLGYEARELPGSAIKRGGVVSNPVEMDVYTG